jgi:uncharacterized membrane protein YdjX (TVP38/TMEM64 family)
MKISGYGLARAGAVVLVVVLLAAAWKWTGLREWADTDRLVDVFGRYRTNWLAFPATVLVFVVAELLLFPVTVLIFVCGLVFGPWLGTLYALTGSLASAIVPFLIGQRLGRERLERMGGPLVRKLERVLDRRGVVAVFLVRKIPAPYTLVNLVCGASPLSLRDFALGTVLGMGTGIILITVISGQLMDMLRHPEIGQIALGVALLLVPVTLALIIQRTLNRRLEVGS